MQYLMFISDKQPRYLPVLILCVQAGTENGYHCFHKAGETDLEGTQLLVEGTLRLAVLLLQLAHLATIELDA